VREKTEERIRRVTGTADGVELASCAAVFNSLYTMTRINVGIAPTNLPDELLLADRYNLIITYREIKRLPYFKRTIKDQTPPSEFTLGKGHIKFFMTRLRYAKERYKILKEEAERRGFMVTDFSQNFEGLGEDEEEEWLRIRRR